MRLDDMLRIFGIDQFTCQRTLVGAKARVEFGIVAQLEGLFQRGDRILR